MKLSVFARQHMAWKAGSTTPGKRSRLPGVNDSDRLAIEAWLAARRGDQSLAEEALKQLEVACRREKVTWCDSSFPQAALGHLDHAFASLQEGLRQRDWKVLFLSIDPRLKSLHSDPRWQDFTTAFARPSTTDTLTGRGPERRNSTESDRASYASQHAACRATADVSARDLASF